MTDNNARRSGANLFRRVFDLDAGLATPRDAATSRPGAGEGTPSDAPSLRPVMRLCNLMLSEAFANGATQVRVSDNQADMGSVEYLINGEWRVVMKIPILAHRALVNRLKIMAGLDISRVPEQSGEVHVTLAGVRHILAIAVQALPSGSDIAVLRLDQAAT